MADEKQILAESLSAEAAQAAAIHAEAVEKSREAQMKSVITEAMENSGQHQQIMTTLAVVVERLGGIDRHLNTLNGKVAEQGKQLTTLEIWKAKLEGAGLVFSTGWTIIISLISGGIVLLVAWFKHIV